MLLQFLKAYLEWAEAGAPEDNAYGFEDFYGLCANADSYEDATYISVQDDLQDYFAEFDRPAYPFGEEEYENEYPFNKSQQPERIEWVRATIKELSDA